MRTIVHSETTRADIAELLAEARARTMLVIEAVPEEDLRVQHDPLMSPILWDLGHIAAFEELWLVRNLERPVEFVEMPGIYNPFEHPRRTRAALPLPSLAEWRRVQDDVRRRVLDKLEQVELDGDDPLLRDGYVYRMVAQHEYQHNETILQTLQLKCGAPYAAPRAVTVPPPQALARAEASDAGPLGAGMVRFPGGEVEIGTDDRSAAYDNERPLHRARIEPFWIDVTPVTNAQYLAFMEDGGYARRPLWSEAGWRFREEMGLEAPKYWSRTGGEWTVRTMDRIAAVDPLRPVCHVCYHEAEAFARWADKRLPSEYEWEAAASWDAGLGLKRDYPWGDSPPAAADVNLDQLAFETAPVGAYPRNVSPIGCYGMLGDVWEWTSSDFRGYPGFESFPYKEYSEVFFGTDYKVLRGGSWATRPGAVRNTFRNWDYPIRRQIFSGFRCARDD